VGVCDDGSVWWCGVYGGFFVWVRILSRFLVVWVDSCLDVSVCIVVVWVNVMYVGSMFGVLWVSSCMCVDIVFVLCGVDDF